MLIIYLVTLSFILDPSPYLPPDHPVFRSHTWASCSSTFSANILAYRYGCLGRKASPKHAENVDYGSVTPISVPATLEVYPLMK